MPCDVGEGRQQCNGVDVLASEKQRQTQSWQRVLPTLQEGLPPSINPFPEAFSQAYPEEYLS